MIKSNEFCTTFLLLELLKVIKRGGENVRPTNPNCFIVQKSLKKKPARTLTGFMLTKTLLEGVVKT